MLVLLLSYPLIFPRAKMQLEVGASLRRLSYDESRSASSGLRIVETEVAPCSMWDFRATLSPRMRAKSLEIKLFSK